MDKNISFEADKLSNVIDFLKKRSFKIQLTLAILLLIIPLISFISYSDYNTAKVNLERSHELMQNQIEQDIETTFNLVDIGLNTIGKNYESDMLDGFQYFISEYEDVGRNVEDMNLTKVYEILNKTYDLYIIDCDGIIISTTYAPDLGLNFSDFSCSFYEQLTQIRLEGNFTLDRVSPEIQTGDVRIYAYMPSPDRQYVFELGLVIDEFSELTSELSYLHAADEFVSGNSFLESIRIFSIFGDLLGDTSFHPSNSLLEIVFDVRDTEQDRTVSNITSNTLTKYIFLSLTNGDYPTESVDFVIELVYTTTIISNQLTSLIGYHILLGIVTFFFTSLITYFGTSRLTKPIHKIAEDAQIISQGVLDHEITEYSTTELKTLSISLNKMVRSLEESKDRAVLYLDLIGHDIMNKFQVIIACMNLITRETTGEQHDNLIIESENAIAECRDLLTKMTLTESLTSNPIAIRQLDIALANTINHIQSKYGEVSIQIEGHYTRANIVGDALLEQLFIMLIENAIKHNVSESKRVWIQVFEFNDGYRISISDNGIGIPDQRKEALFDISRRYGGVDLHLCKHMVQKYGGTIDVNNRVEGDYTKGTEFIIWLPRAE
ncbi:MAG: putative Histidine kinase [Candidatus Thorarchaeota archaeon]|nr:MAG: putative Histidine kinase [Candidatus Thorarchaeota archaeon]